MYEPKTCRRISKLSNPIVVYARKTENRHICSLIVGFATAGVAASGNMTDDLTDSMY